ncbi:hypothetical protein [Kribbella deserti]|uniref:Antibiotic biosynthesis monooxygenase n=1 Tax=Kribbella deserti TaxID=1926257 RepID=A0ABV6QPA1_9ACTN
MAAFVQIIEYQTSRMDEVADLSEEFRAARMAENQSRETAPTRITVAEDRDRPGYYLNIVEFESYEAAMENSGRPETADFAAKLAELCDGPPKFYNLDVVQRIDLG